VIINNKKFVEKEMANNIYENIDELINSAVDQQPSQFAKTFDNIMTDKISNALSDYQDTYAQQMFQTSDEDDDDDDIDIDDFEEEDFEIEDSELDDDEFGEEDFDDLDLEDLEIQDTDSEEDNDEDA